MRSRVKSLFVVLTAVLFALLHCVGGIAGFPHRFAGGLALGWLRLRSGSLLPGPIAHASHNLLAITLV